MQTSIGVPSMLPDASQMARLVLQFLLLLHLFYHPGHWSYAISSVPPLFAAAAAALRISWGGNNFPDEILHFPFFTSLLL